MSAIAVHKRFEVGLPIPLILACMVEGAAWAIIHGYGPLYMRQALGEPRLSMVALSTGLTSLTTFVMANVWGRWADKVGRSFRLIQGGLSGAAGLMLLFYWINHSMVYVLLCMATSACLAAVAPLGLAWITAQHPEKPGRQASRFYQARAIGSTLGNFGGSLLVKATGIHGFLVALTGIAIAAIGAVITLQHTTSQPGSQQSLHPNRATMEGAASSTVWKNPLIPVIAVVVFLSFGSNQAFFSLIGPYYTEYLAGTSASLGIALGVASIVGLLAVGPVGRFADAHNPLAVFFLGVTSYIGIYGLLSVLRHPLAVLILFAIPIYPLIAIGTTGILNQQVKPDQRAEAMGVFEGSAALALAGGSLCAGLGTDWLGLAALPVIALVLAITGVLVALVTLRTSLKCSSRHC